VSTNRLEYMRAWRAANRDKVRDYQKRWHAENPDLARAQRRRHRLKQRYGLRPSSFERMSESQRGACAICGGPPGEQGLHVDHDHKTGKVRALLCFECNSGLGKFREDPQLLAAAIAYLEHHK